MGKKVHSTHLILRPEQYEQVRKDAFTKRVTISEVVRQALDSYFKKPYASTIQD